MRHPVSYTMAMKGGRVVRLQHVNGSPVAQVRTSHCNREYCHIGGSGVIDTNKPVSNMVRVPTPRNLTQMLAQTNIGGSVGHSKVSKEKLLSEIARSMASGRKRR